MLSLLKYVKIFEGGQAGHMAHPVDYTDFTGNDLKELVDSLFGGKVEQMKEKLDGMNIFATMNNRGEAVFIRNNGDLQSEKGGMSVDDMIEKWATKEHQKQVFSQAGEIITRIFSRLGKEFFNPDSETRKVINCECIVAGKTNIMPYASDRVAFHGYKIYKKGIIQSGKLKGQEGWIEDEDVEGHVEDIYKAAEGIDAAKPRPNLVIRSAIDAAKFAEKFGKRIEQLFKDENLTMQNTIDDWKQKRFNDIKPDWMTKEVDKIYNRWFNGDKSFKATELKKIYPNAEQYEIVKGTGSDYIGKVMQPLDMLFLAIGNELIDLLTGFTNDGAKDKVITSLKQDIESTVDMVKKSGSVEAQVKLNKSLIRLQELGDKYNAAEGIVFMYKGRRMKLTGSFAPINQCLGIRFMFEN